MSSLKVGDVIIAKEALQPLMVHFRVSTFAGYWVYPTKEYVDLHQDEYPPVVPAGMKMVVKGPVEGLVHDLITNELKANDGVYVLVLTMDAREVAIDSRGTTPA